MSLAIPPSRAGFSLPVHKDLIQTLDNWRLDEVNSLFQKIGCIKSSDDQIVVQISTLNDEQVIEQLAGSFHAPGRSLSIVQQLECYVNEEIHYYYVLSSSTSIFSSCSPQLNGLKETINQTQFLPVAWDEQGRRYFAPDIVHVVFSEAWEDSKIQRWANGLGLIYQEHKFSRGLYSSAVVCLPQNKNMVSLCKEIQELSEVLSVRPHELLIRNGE